jgi:hypothetical protein
MRKNKKCYKHYEKKFKISQVPVHVGTALSNLSLSTSELRYGCKFYNKAKAKLFFWNIAQEKFTGVVSEHFNSHVYHCSNDEKYFTSTDFRQMTPLISTYFFLVFYVVCTAMPPKTYFTLLLVFHSCRRELHQRPQKTPLMTSHNYPFGSFRSE